MTDSTNAVQSTTRQPQQSYGEKHTLLGDIKGRPQRNAREAASRKWNSLAEDERKRLTDAICRVQSEYEWAMSEVGDQIQQAEDDLIRTMDGIRDQWGDDAVNGFMLDDDSTDIALAQPESPSGGPHVRIDEVEEDATCLVKG
jgi:hypothetical protein